MRVYTASIPAKSGKETGRAPTPFRGRAETRADKSEVKGGQKPVLIRLKQTAASPDTHERIKAFHVKKHSKGIKLSILQAQQTKHA